MSNITAEQAIRKVANSLINTHRPQLGASHSLAIEASLEALAELADELSLIDIYAELTKRLDILRGGCRPHIIGVDLASGHDITVIFQPPQVAVAVVVEQPFMSDERSFHQAPRNDDGVTFMPPFAHELQGGAK